MATSTPTTMTTLEHAPAPSIARDLADQFRDFYGATSLFVGAPKEEDDSVEILAVPAGKVLVSTKKFIDEYRTRPERRQGTATLKDVDSFCAHVNRFKDLDSAIFANPDRAKPSLTAVYDYHESLAGERVVGDHLPQPRFGIHRAFYPCPLSEEWTAWTSAHGKLLDQRTFAAFLEDHITDVVLPPDRTAADFDAEKEAGLFSLVDSIGGRLGGPSQLMTLARGLAINVETKVRDAFTLDTGEIKVTYEETHTSGQGSPVSVPNLFLLAIPIFYAGDLYRLPVRLRYRLNGGSMTWSFHLYRADRAFDDAFNGVCTTAGEETGLPLFRGAPEA